MAAAQHKKRRWRTRKQDRALVPAVVRLLHNGGPCPTFFAYEGAVHAGLRAGFCLDGVKWHTSNIRAGRIVAEALSLLGAVRPSWAEGQRDWCQPSAAEGERWSCIRCGADIPEERFYGGRLAKWCSPECRRRAIDSYNRKALGQLNRIEYLATMTALRERRQEEKGYTCESCGKRFLKNGGSPCTPRFCSLACRERALVVKACIVCGELFRPRQKPEVECCSEVCYTARWREARKAAGAGTARSEVANHLSRQNGGTPVNGKAKNGAILHPDNIPNFRGRF